MMGRDFLSLFFLICRCVNAVEHKYRNVDATKDVFMLHERERVKLTVPLLIYLLDLFYLQARTVALC